jgi:hypothetical protein
MNDYASKIREFIEHGGFGRDAQAYLTGIIGEIPDSNVGPVVFEATKHILPYPLGYILSALLEERLHRDDDLFEKLSEFLAQPKANLEFRIVLLDILCGHARANDKRIKSFRDKLHKIAASKRQPVNLRARMLRALKPTVEPESTRLLGAFLDSGSPGLIDAAAHVVASWQAQGRAVPDAFVASLTRYVETSPARVFKSPGVMMALAAPKAPTAVGALHNLVDQIRTTEDRASILRAAGAQLDTRLLARIIQQVIHKDDGQSPRVLQAIFVSDPQRLADLYSNGYSREYLYGLTLAPDLIGSTEAEHLLELREDLDATVRKQAQRTIMLATSRTGLAHLQSKACQLHPRIAARNALSLSALDEWLDKSRDAVEGLFAPDPGKVEDGYNTDYHKADAIYRDLGWLQYSLLSQNHWHAFLYQGFSVTDDVQGKMVALQSDGNVMRFDQAEVDFSAPGISVRQQMQNLQASFQAVLGEAGPGSPYPLHAGRRTPGITAKIAEQIVSTGESLVGKGIDYTWVDMLQQRGDAWSGTATDIEKIRCDGVVEFCYEKNSQRVSRGIDGDEWNIAKAGNRFLDNHNDFHNWFYEEGELCPRIQAGDHSDPNEIHNAAPANATRMTTSEGPELPQVGDFYVNPQFLFFAPMIGFRIEASRYNHVYVRLTVSRDGGPFHFVRTEDPYGSEEAAVADWQFVKVATGRDIVGWWLGKTVNGPDYASQSGPFEFRLVTVDLAGNVSELRRVTVVAVWP